MPVVFHLLEIIECVCRAPASSGETFGKSRAPKAAQGTGQPMFAVFAIVAQAFVK
jgi:hypothetical protein